MNPPKSNLTPLQVLTCEKNKLTKQCDQQEQLIGEHINYIHQNAGSLLIKGVSSVLFPTTVPKRSEPVANQPEDGKLTDYLTQLKGYLPMVWDIARPLLITWGIGKFRRNLKILLRKL